MSRVLFKMENLKSILAASGKKAFWECSHPCKTENPKDLGFTSVRSGKKMRWKCPCDRWYYDCTKDKCKALGDRCGLVVGHAMCACGKRRAECPPCTKLFAEKKQKLDETRAELGFYRHGRNWGCTHKTFIGNCNDPKCMALGKTCDLTVGSNYCHHTTKTGTLIRKQQCRICDLAGYYANLRRHRRWLAFKSGGKCGALEDLCMSSKEWVVYLNDTFVKRYGRERTPEDEIDIDEIVQCAKWDLPEDNKYCWHFKNSRLLLKKHNRGRRRSTQEEKEAMIQEIDEENRCI